MIMVPQLLQDYLTVDIWEHGRLESFAGYMGGWDANEDRRRWRSVDLADGEYLGARCIFLRLS